MTVSKIDPVNNYTGNGSTTTFDFDFLIEDEAELLVQHTNSLGVQVPLVLNVDYVIDKTGENSGSFITFPIEGSQYQTLQYDEVISLSANLPIEQTKEYRNSSKLQLGTLEWSLDYIIRLIQILNRKVIRAIKVQESPNIDTETLVNNINNIADDLSIIENVNNNEQNINIVSSNIGIVNTVAPSITNVNRVGNSINNVNAVAGDLNNVDIVGGNIADVNIAANDINSINITANNINAVKNCASNNSNITTTANNINAVKTVSNNIIDVITTTENINDVNTLADNIADVNTVANVSNNVTAVADKIGNVNTVATNINNLNKVANISANVTTVAGSIGNINTVAVNIAAVDNCSDNMGAITEAPDYAQFAADCLASCQAIQGQFGIVSFLNGGSSANITQTDIYDGGTSSVISENIYSGGNSEYKNVLTYDDIKKIHEIAALQTLVNTLANKIETLENIKVISGGVA